MSKTRDTGFLGNVVKYDANGNVNIVSGSTTLLSVSSSGQLTVPGNEVITGSLTVLGGITGAITGSATSASYAANTSLLNNSGSGEFVPTGSFNTFSSSVLTYTGSVNSQLSALQTTSGSNITRIAALEVISGSNITRISALESASGSAITRLSALEVTSGSNITRLSSLEARTGSYATTGSNTFDGGQYFSSSFNPTGFSTTASLYTDGGLRVSRDAYVSGTLYLNNLTVFGTQSVAYISSSQLNIGTNLITVNTDTPSIRFGGLAVYDSGSTGLTGSILWDSQNNHWVYTNPSGSSYSGGMFISGPRASSLGSETGTTSCMLMAGQGGDHITSSMIYHSSTVTCIPNTLVGSAVCSTMINTSCMGIGTTTPAYDLTLSKSVAAGNVVLNIENTSTTGAARLWLGNNTSSTGARIQYFGATHAARPNLFSIGTDAANDMMFETSGTERARITSAGIACFACQICVPNIISTGTSGGRYGTFNAPTNGGYITFEAGGTPFGDLGSYCAQYGTGDATTFLLGSRTGYALALGTNSTERLRINSSGNVLINCSRSEYGQLQVSTLPTTAGAYASALGLGFLANACEGASTGISFYTKISLGAGIWENARIASFTDAVSTSAYGALAFYTMNATTLSERMRIGNNGFVGIGATSPGVTLDIKCDSSSTDVIGSGASSLRLLNACAANTNNFHTGIWFRLDNGISNKNGYIKLVNDTTNVTGDFAFILTQSGTESERLRIKGNGNVGIGCSTPTSPLTIRCDSSSGASFMEIATCFNSSYRYVSINAGSGISYCIPAGTSQSPFIEVQGGAPEAAGGSFKIRTGAMGSVSDRLVINQSGIACFSNTVCALGLNLTGASDAVLNMTAPGATAYITFKNACNSIWGIGASFIGRTCNLEVYNFSTNTNVLTIDKTGITCFAGTVCTPTIISSGNVGIGAEGSLNRLTVAGHIESRYVTSACTVNCLKLGTYSGGQWGSFVAAQSHYASNIDTNLIFGTTLGGDLGERMKIAANGVVRIGTCAITTNANSNVALQVAGAIKFGNPDGEYVQSYGGGISAKSCSGFTPGSTAIIVKGLGGSGFLYQVFGFTLTGKRFTDLLLGVNNIITVVASTTEAGPSTRCYTVTSENLNLCLSGAENYNIVSHGFGAVER